MLKILGLIVVVAVVVVLIRAALAPKDFTISRSVVIAAPAAAIYPEISDHQRARVWSPWEKMDPAMQRSFEGPATGLGSVYRWSGNKDVGEGKVTIQRLEPNQRVELDLEFYRPMKGRNLVVYSLSPETTGTRMTWTMSGAAPFMSRLMCQFMNMDKMVGGQFEKGLADLKTLVEAKQKGVMK